MAGGGTGRDRGVALIVVAGGASRRMGEDKATRTVGGQPALLHVLALGAAVGATPRIVVARAGQSLPPLPATALRVDDPPEREGEGPLPAMATGLAALGDAAAPGAVLVLSTDAIGIQVRDLQLLLEHLEGHEAAVPRSEGRWHPLVAAYVPAAVAPVIGELVASGTRRLQALPGVLDVAVIPEAWLSATALTACNTPERWGEVERAISRAADDPGPRG